MLKERLSALVCVALLCLSFVAVLWSRTGPEQATTSVIRIRVSSKPAQTNANSPRLFAYVLYATSEIYLCNAVINARRLRNLGVTADADIVVLTDEAFLEESSEAVAKRIHAMRALGVGAPAVPFPYGSSEWGAKVEGSSAGDQRNGPLDKVLTAGQGAGCEDPEAGGRSILGSEPH